jgi:predicted nucleic acid-binding protein
MIILDTNVVSELVSPRCSPAVRSWLDAQVNEGIFITAINLSELLLGIELLPQGKRRQGLSQLLEEFVERLGEDHVLQFDEPSARAYALIISRSRFKGRAISIPDGQIAAIAESRGYAVATRDTSPFEAAGVAFVNSWETR